jgi:hypothetical protein
MSLPVLSRESYVLWAFLKTGTKGSLILFVLGTVCMSKTGTRGSSISEFKGEKKESL